jgi:alkyl hydroperoxide reductase subunit AhpC/tRNA A-37 threonylcarbamoyl transferase component Bud32
MRNYAPPVANDIDETAVDALLRAWDSERGPSLDAFLADRDPVSASSLVQLVRVDQASRWRVGERVKAETYLTRFDRLRDDPERALDVILREQSGERIQAEEYYARFPDYVDGLRRQLAVHTALESEYDPVRVGSPAPNFSLPSTRNLDQLGESITLAEHRGKWLVLFFYPHDFSLVCPTEVKAFSRRIDEFRQLNTAVLGVSTDPIDIHVDWITRPREQGGLGGLNFPLASDMTGEVCARYGVLLREQSVALRGLFIVDPGGILQYIVVHNLAVGRRCEQVLRVLSALQTGGACGESWEAGDPVLQPPPAPEPNMMLTHYLLRDQLGKGSSALVFRAVDVRLQRQVALKVLRREDKACTQRLLDEAQSTASLTHPNICVVYEVNATAAYPFIAMQYVEGVTLRELIERGPMAPQRIVAIGLQITDALTAAHAAHLVHGDLKPHNVMVAENGHVTLLDFGLATKLADDPHGAAMPETATLAGTPAYMSPEQVRGESLEPRSDVFSLGALLLQMATSRLPFPGQSAWDVTAAILESEPVIPASVPAGLAKVLTRMLAKSPAERYLSMPAVRDDLVACLDS